MYGAVEFHTLCCDPLECNSRRQRSVIHCRSVPPPHPPPYFVGEGGIPSNQYFQVLYRRYHPLSPVLLQCCLIGTSHISESLLFLSWLPPCGDSLVNESPRLHDIHELQRATRFPDSGLRAATQQRSCPPESSSNRRAYVSGGTSCA